MTPSCQEILGGECLENVHETVSLIATLGFTIHKEVSFRTNTVHRVLRGFVINSVDMAVKINPKKSQVIIEKIKNVYITKNLATTRQLALVIGSCISLFQPSHYANCTIET